MTGTLDKRTETYFDLIKKNTNFVGDLFDNSPVEFKEISKFITDFSNIGDLTIGTAEESPLWTAEIKYFVDDECQSFKYFFSRKPTEEQVLLVIDFLDTLELFSPVQNPNINTTFICSECEKEAHWLDGLNLENAAFTPEEFRTHTRRLCYSDCGC